MGQRGSTSAGCRSFHVLNEKSTQLSAPSWGAARNTHLFTVKRLHAQMELTEATEATQQEPSIIGEENPDFIFHVSLLACASHDVAGDVKRMFGFCAREETFHQSR